MSRKVATALTTAQQIKKLAAPLIARNPDLALVGRLLVLRPVSHVVRGIFFDRTGQANQCQPRWLLMDLLTRQDDIVFDAGHLLHRKGLYRPGLWWLDDPDLSADLVSVAEGEVLPKLRMVQTLGDALDLILPRDPVERTYCWGTQFVFALALGELSEARSFLQRDRERVYIGRLNDYSEGLGDRLVEQGARLSAEDRMSIAAYLHECEEYTVDRLKMRHVWERMPFPLEMQREGGSVFLPE